jgi:hypothetical protein
MPDPGGDINDVAGLAQRRFLLQALVRTVAVVVPGVLSQDLAEMPLAEDQYVVQALTAERANEPFRIGIGPHRRLHPIQMIGTAVCG